MEEESNGELAFLDTLLKRNNGEISVLVYRKHTHTDQYLHQSSRHQTSCKESLVSSLFNRAYSIITNKYDLYRENARINPANIFLDEDVLKRSFVFLFRRVNQDKYIHFTHTSLEDVLIQTNIFVLIMRLPEVFKKLSRRLQDV